MPSVSFSPKYRISWLKCTFNVFSVSSVSKLMGCNLVMRPKVNYYSKRKQNLNHQSLATYCLHPFQLFSLPSSHVSCLRIQVFARLNPVALKPRDLCDVAVDEYHHHKRNRIEQSDVEDEMNFVQQGRLASRL